MSFSVLFHPVYPETQMVSSHTSSSRTEVTRIENVCIDDAHGTATQKSRMDQQMSTALHGMPNSVTKQARDMCTCNRACNRLTALRHSSQHTSALTCQKKGNIMSAFTAYNVRDTDC